MIFDEFREIMVEELQFYGKNFSGEEFDRKRALNGFLSRYFESLCHLSTKQFKLAFMRCRENWNYFPSVAQLLKFSPAKPKAQQDFHPKFVEVKPEMKKMVDGILKGPKEKLTKKQVIANFQHLQKRNPTFDWRPVIKRELEILEKLGGLK